LFPSTFHTFIESTDTIYDREVADLSSSIEAAWSARHTTQFKTISAALITRLLDLDSPKIDDKLVDFLMIDGNLILPEAALILSENRCHAVIYDTFASSARRR
jgi:hypothetical protein